MDFYLYQHFGLSGIAIATVLIQIINMFYLFYKVLQTKLIHFEKPIYFLPNIHVYKQFIIQGYLLVLICLQWL